HDASEQRLPARVAREAGPHLAGPELQELDPGAVEGTVATAPAVDGGVDQGDRRLAGMPALLLTPLLVFLLTFFVLPFAVMFVQSLYLSPLQNPAGVGLTFANYAKAFGDAFYLRVLLQTVALGVAVTALALVLGYPEI